MLNRSKLALLLAGLIFLIAGAPTNAQAGHAFRVDESRSAVEFSVKHFMLSNVSGRFSKFSGRVDYDGKSISNATVQARVNMASIDTKNKMRDDHLRAQDILDVEHFPVMTFNSREIVPTSDGRFKITGTLKLHGIEKEITFDSEPLRPLRRDEDNRLRTGTTAATTIDRKLFNIFVDKAVDKSGALVGEKVKVTLKIDLVEDAGTSSELL